ANKSGVVSGGSIMGLMMLAAASGTDLDITARGPEADQALDALVRLVEGGFQRG
ncbi:MAG: HPr family phosphocarrier protein, partial [Alphaproteobacteria bacterium]